MAKSKEIPMTLPSLDDIFTTQEEREEEKKETVKDILLSEISEFPNHPFKVKNDEKMAEMVNSVEQYGILVPALVRPKADGGYEMIAGHRRWKASSLAGRETIPCIVRELTDDESTIIMVDSNLQREEILPSEKAFAYKMKLEAMKRQGQRVDLTSSPMATKLRGKRSDEILGQQVGEGKDTIRRYIRLTELIPQLLDMVDEKQIALRPAVELSYLSREDQKALHDMIQQEDCTPSHAQAIRMRKLSEEGRLDGNVIYSILSEVKDNQKEQFKIPKERIRQYFSPGTPAKQMEDTIVKALEQYRRRERSRERKQER